jgi:hypothetical protein
VTDANVPAGFIPFDEIPDSGVLLDGVYHVAGEELIADQSSTGKKMYSGRMVVMLPEDYKGMYVFENFVIGADDDPMATQLSTWKKSIGARRFKGMMKAAGIPSGNDEAAMCAGFQGVQFMIVVSQYTEKGGDYDGTIRNRIGGFYRVGERVAEVTGKQAGAGGAVVSPTPVMPTAAPVTPSPAPASAPQPVAAAPPVTGAPTAPAAATPEAAAPTASELPCGICNKKVPVAEFQAHIATCMANTGQQA